jgi:hypothetical protein
MAEDQPKFDRELTKVADKLIPETESAIRRAAEAIQKNQELLDRLTAEREERESQGR